MPLKKEEAHHALELLEVYHAQLANTNDSQLRQSLERVITTLKSRLFDALLDIQEYYEVTIANETRAAQQKAAADMMAGRWMPNAGDITTLAQAHFSFMTPGGEAAPIGGVVQYPYEEQGATVFEDWVFDEIHLVKPESGGYGFSIAGGRDAPHVGNDPSVFITKLTPGSPAANDGRLSVGSVVLSVNDSTFVNVTRAEAVTSLKQAGDRVHMVFKRLKYDPTTLLDIMLSKTSRGLGFSIAGGVGNEHVPGDPGIFITRLIDGGAAGVDGRLQIGDRIVQVNDIRFERISHEEAVQVLKATAQNVRIIAQKPSYPINEQGLPMYPHAADPAAYPYGMGQPGNPAPIPMAAPIPVQPLYQPPPQPVMPAPPVQPEPTPASVPVSTPAPVTIPKAKPAPPPAPAVPVPLPPPAEPVLPAPVVAVQQEAQAAAPAPVAKPKKKKRAEPVPPPVLEPALAEPAASAPVIASVQRAVESNPPPAEPSMPAPPPKPTKKKPPKAPPVAPVAAAEPMNVEVEAPPPAPAPKKREPPGPPIRKVVLRRGAAGLGFNIVGGEDTEEGIFISHIVPGGAADTSGQIQRGDQILAVNGRDIQRASHEEAARALKSAGEQVELTLIFRPNEYAAFEAKLAELHGEEPPPPPVPTVSGSTSTAPADSNQLVAKVVTPANPSLKKNALIVRALFDYDPSKDSGLPSKGLSFRFGDVLAVTNSSDDEWWQAKRLRASGADDSSPGIIPSKKRVEKKERARLRRVGWGGQSGDKKKDDDDEIPVASYMPVQLMEINYTRPVVILGPFKDRLNDDLQNEDPNRFATFVPHTTREKREQEVDGRDYYFVASREQMERDIEAGLFIEAGHYQGNLYGTSVKAVVDVSLSGKHCILDVSGNALKRLEQNNLFPIAIFVKPKSIETITEINKRMSEDQAKKAFERAQKTESDFVQYFTAVVQGDSAHEYQTRTLEAIDAQNTKSVWAPLRDVQI